MSHDSFTEAWARAASGQDIPAQEWYDTQRYGIVTNLPVLISPLLTTGVNWVLFGRHGRKLSQSNSALSVSAMTGAKLAAKVQNVVFLWSMTWLSGYLDPE